eukprot:gene2447-5387_t
MSSDEEVYEVDKKNKRGKIQRRQVVIDPNHMVLRTRTTVGKLRRELKIMYLREINVISSEGFSHVVKLRWQDNAPTDHSVYFLIFPNSDMQCKFAKRLLDLRIQSTGFPPKGNAMSIFKDPDLQPASENDKSASNSLSVQPIIASSPSDETTKENLDETPEELIEVYNESSSQQENPNTLNTTLVITVLGASSNFAKYSVYPMIWQMYRKKLIPRESLFLGVSRNNLTADDFISRLRPHIHAGEDDKSLADEFLNCCEYYIGDYYDEVTYTRLDEYIKLRAANKGTVYSNRVFYVTTPLPVIEPVTKFLSTCCQSKDGWTRVVLEPPFGKDLQSFLSTTNHISQFFKEDQIFRINHYLGNEMVQNVIMLRFGNRLFHSIWDRKHIQAVIITVKESDILDAENIDFHSTFIVRDIMQTHLLQLLSLVAMETPLSLKDTDLKYERLKCLRCTEPVSLENVTLGQYTSGNDHMGFVHQSGVDNARNAPTFAVSRLNVRTTRWDGVPFILKCGKGLNQTKSEVRIQFRDNLGEIFENTTRNELVMRVMPSERVQVKMHVKEPGVAFSPVQTHFDLRKNCLSQLSEGVGAFERLFLDVIQGERTYFLSKEEISEGWRIFSPLLSAINANLIKLDEYPFGSRGP